MKSLDDAIRHHRAGRLEDAARAYVSFLRERPDHADALQWLGMALFQLGHAESALAALDRAVAADKRHAHAHANRGLVLHALARPVEAREALKRAVRLDRSLAAAFTELGRVEASLGDLSEAVAAHARALTLEPTRDRAIALADAVLVCPDPPADLGAALAIAMADPGVDHARLDRAVRAALAPLRDEPSRLVAAPLLAPWMTRSVVAHPGWEAALVRARSYLLARAVDSETAIDAAIAFALQGYANEYAWPTTSADRSHLAALDPSRVDHAAVAAMFAPLPGRWRDAPELAALVRRTFEEPELEATLAATIPELGHDHPTSAAVRDLYEHNPYPRLISIHRTPGRSFADAIRQLLPGVEGLPTGPVDVLVAGCGTGRHALQSALAWSDATVLGIDLSRASLGRAARLAREHGVSLTLRRGDLLHAAALDRTFDVVESVGVLHHLDDPLTGWRALIDQLRPGGLLRIGLYSEAGRADVVAAREVIADHRLEATPDGIREARRLLAALPEHHPAHPIVFSPDFASLSGCRDLVFHVREHRTDPTALRRTLDTLGFEVLGFQVALPLVAAAYDERGTADPCRADLDRWSHVERALPRAFSGMYLFWARRRPEPGHSR